MVTTRKTERILNLTICLLVTRRFLPKAHIREIVEGYADLSDVAFERTFERDKDELRALGIPIQVGSFDPLFDDEPGYRIDRSDFELPSIELDAEEAAVVGVAARVWQHASVAESTRSALAKLRAAGIEPDASHLAALEPSVQASEPAFEPLWNAVIARTRMAFTYRDGSTRTLEPWGITSHKGRWYVIGRDVDRDAPRMFKLSRMTDVPRPVSRAGAFAVPADVDLRSLARALGPVEPTREAVLAVRRGKVPSLRRRGRALPQDAQQGDRPDDELDAPADGPSDRYTVPSGFDLVAVGFRDLGPLAEELTGYGADVIVLEPNELRQVVVRRLSAVVGIADRPGRLAAPVEVG